MRVCFYFFEIWKKQSHTYIKCSKHVTQRFFGASEPKQTLNKCCTCKRLLQTKTKQQLQQNVQHQKQLNKHVQVRLIKLKQTLSETQTTGTSEARLPVES